jgi:DNA topoisomerase-1
MTAESVTLDDALRLLSLPREIGHDEAGVPIVAHLGRFGGYLKRGNDSRSLEREDQIFTVTVPEALALFAQPKTRQARGQAPPLKAFGNDPVSGKPIVVKQGRFGLYVTDGDTNATLHRDDALETLSEDRAIELLQLRREKEASGGGGARGRGKGRGAKAGAKAPKAAAKAEAATEATPKKAAAKSKAGSGNGGDPSSKPASSKKGKPAPKAKGAPAKKTAAKKAPPTKPAGRKPSARP